MGSFSWTRAEHTTKRSNLTYGDSYKILIPKEFGGGYIKDTYYDYGYVFHDTDHEADLYGILAYWNHCEGMIYDCDHYPETMEEILKYGRTCDDNNRCTGIDIGCYDDQIDRLKYPLKLVSASYKGTYEDCAGRSYGDYNQGFGKGYWKHEDYEDELVKLIKAENEIKEVKERKAKEEEENRIKTYKYICDGGCFLIGNRDFSVTLPNNFGDGEFTITVLTQTQWYKNGYQNKQYEWKGIINGIFYIYDYDYIESSITKALAELKGKYSIYVWSGEVVLCKDDGYFSRKTKERNDN